MPADYETMWPKVWEYATARDLGKAAKDWPKINFMYHGALRNFLEKPDAALAEFEQTGRAGRAQREERLRRGTDSLCTARPSGRSRRCAGSGSREDMQKKHGFKPRGPAEGPVKRAIFGGNTARLYGLKPQRDVTIDKIAVMKAEYLAAGGQPTNARYGYIARSRP